MTFIARNDGSIIIDTLIDTKGFGKGAANMQSQFAKLTNAAKSLGAAIGLAFGVAQIVQFCKDSSQAAMQLSDSLQGLKSILDGQGRSFSSAQSFIEEYTADGLIPATNAITAYKNLAMRGYDDSQIRQVMVALKDASAYGRQASYTMGEAVESASEGLKNENSILVDNAGVTKNVAKMWEEYAASIGTTSNNLTQQQKIQAEVTGILEESKYQTGDAAKVAGTLSGQLQQLSFNFNNLKVAVGNAVNPILQAVLPVINIAISAMTKLANAIATVVGLIFGKVSASGSAVADSVGGAAESYEAASESAEDYGNAASAAAKKAKKSLASFDELNKLDAPDSGSGGSGGSGGASGAVSSSGGNIVAEASVDDTISPKLQAIADKIKELVAPLKNIDLGPVVSAFSELKEALSPLTKKAFAGLEWLWYNILVPLAEWTIEDAVPAFLNLLSGALRVLNSVLDSLQPLAQWLWEEFLQPIAKWTGEAIISALKELTDLLQDLASLMSGEMSFSEFVSDLTALQSVLVGISGALAVISGGKAISNLMNQFNGLHQTITNLNASGILGKFGEVIAIVSSKAGSLSEAMNLVFGPGSIIAGIAAVVGGIVLAITNFLSMLGNGFSWASEALMLLGIAIAAVGAVILGAPATAAAVVAGIVAAVATLAVVVKEHWDEIVAACEEAWEKIAEAWEVVSEWFDENIIQPVSEFFSELWASVTQWASDAWESIKEFFSPAVQWFTELLESINQTFEDIFYNIGVIASGCWEIIKAVWEVVSTWFDENIIQPVATFFEDLWADVSASASDAWENIKEIFSAVASWIDENVIQPVSDYFSGLWEDFSELASEAWDEVKEVFEGVGSFFKGILNGVIRALNNAIRWIFSGVNRILTSLKNIEVLGLTPFSGIRTIAVPQIPYLAQGAVIPPNAPFMAVLGDQKHGTNIEAPLSTIQEAVAAVMGDQVSAMMAGFNALLEENQRLRQVVEGIELGDSVIGQAASRYQQRMAIVRGG